jgi:hypothetical protein
MTAIPETFQYSQQSATPELILVVIALAALAFVAIAFAHKLRDDDGGVSTERVSFSLIGSILCFITAWFGLVVDVQTGFQTHALYQLSILSIFFVLLGIIMFTNFIYCLVAPEIIKPDVKQYKMNVDSKVKAEGKEREPKEKEESDEE